MATTTVQQHQHQNLSSSDSSDQLQQAHSQEQHPKEDVLTSDEFEDCEFHDCLEMETLYLSFDDAQDMIQQPSSSFTPNIPDEEPEEAFHEASHHLEHHHSRSESDAFYSCDGRPSDEDAETTDQETIRQSSPAAESFRPSPTSSGRHSESEDPALMEKRHLAFLPCRIESYPCSEAICTTTTTVTMAVSTPNDEPSPYLRSIEASTAELLTPLQPCTLAESFVHREERSGTASTEMNSTTPDMLVTLTTTDMGISAKREDSLDRRHALLRTRSQSAVEDVWNVDSIPDSSIFDKARLVEEPLDTADFNKCMASPSSDARLPVNDLPSLRIQERYSDELRSIARSHHHSSSSSIPQIHHAFPFFPTVHHHHHHVGQELIRSHSAPTDMKAEGSRVEDIMEEDVEIESILRNSRGVSSMVGPFSIAEERLAVVGTSSTDPLDEATVHQSYGRGNKKSRSAWFGSCSKKMQSVSFDAESDVASVTRSEYIKEMKRAMEQRDEERRLPHHYHQSSSRLGQFSGFHVGPSVSPVPPGGIRDFSRDDAIELNAALRNDPQLSNVPMGEWTSKLIGFATPADYYVHMIDELSKQRINVLALIQSRLGDYHPLVCEITEKLQNYTTDVPSFVLGPSTTSSKGHRRTAPLAQHQRLPQFVREHTDDCERVEGALFHCGINIDHLDKMRCAFESEEAYYRYLVRKINAEGLPVSAERLKEYLGDCHPFIAVLEKNAGIREMHEVGRTGVGNDDDIMQEENEVGYESSGGGGGGDPLTDSARSIQPTVSASKPSASFAVDSHISKTYPQHQVVTPRSKYRGVSDVSRCSCFCFGFGVLKKSLTEKFTKSEKEKRKQ